jgi:hypothetical protein
MGGTIKAYVLGVELSPKKKQPMVCKSPTRTLPLAPGWRSMTSHRSKVEKTYRTNAKSHQRRARQDAAAIEGADGFTVPRKSDASVESHHLAAWALAPATSAQAAAETPTRIRSSISDALYKEPETARVPPSLRASSVRWPDQRLQALQGRRASTRSPSNAAAGKTKSSSLTR